jgi:hypothetical protein
MIDLTGLDGCSFVLELEDGTRLEPSGYNPDGDLNAIPSIEWVDGKKVYIDYVPVTEWMSICMAGQMVMITCISEVKTSTVTD